MSEWREFSLGDLASFRKGVSYTSADYADRDSGRPFITIKCFVKGGGYAADGLKYIRGDFNPADQLLEGDIIFSVTDLTRAGDIVGSPLQIPFFGADEYCVASMDCMQIKPNDLVCNRDFLYQRMMLADVRRQMVAYSAGSTVLHLDTKQVPRIICRAPVDVRVQAKIARILQTIDQAIEKTEALIDKYQQIKVGMMHDLFTRGIDPNGQLRPSREQAPELYHETPIGWTPKEWGYCPISELSIGGLVNGVFKEPSRVGDGVPLINVADLYKGDDIKLLECERFLATQTEKARYAALVGDIFFTRSSLKLAGIAQTNLLNQASEPAVFECHVMRLRPDPNKVAPKVLKEWCLSANARSHFMAYAKQVTMTTISQDGILGLLCPDIPHAEQERLAEVFFTAESRLRSERLLLEKLYCKKAGLLHDLLTGKVPIRVNPEEEPEEPSA